jgi:hypothetical protein
MGWLLARELPESLELLLGKRFIKEGIESIRAVRYAVPGQYLE